MKKIIKRSLNKDRANLSDGLTIYSRKRRSQMLENDEISPWEAAFMEGWENN